jgi:type IV secretory pathway TraG/TraD family ATPase VirD4
MQTPEQPPYWPVLFMLDEFGQLGPTNIPQQMTYMRGFGGQVMLLVQTLSQLREIYGQEGANTILGASGAQLYMGISDLSTAEHVSRLLGVKTQVKRERVPRGAAGCAYQTGKRAGAHGDMLAGESQGGGGKDLASSIGAGAGILVVAGVMKMFGKSAFYKENVSTHQRQLMTADEVMRSSGNAPILHIAGQRPMLTFGIRYFNDRHFAGLLKRAQTESA